MTAKYWPAEQSAKYHFYIVDPVSVEETPNFTLRQFKVNDMMVRLLCVVMCLVEGFIPAAICLLWRIRIVDGTKNIPFLPNRTNF